MYTRQGRVGPVTCDEALFPFPPMTRLGRRLVLGGFRAPAAQCASQLKFPPLKAPRLRKTSRRTLRTDDQSTCCRARCR